MIKTTDDHAATKSKKRQGGIDFDLLQINDDDYELDQNDPKEEAKID